MSLEDYYKEYDYSINKPTEYWKKQGEKLLKWNKPFNEVFRRNGNFVEWYCGGEVNACYNCVDRHIVGDLEINLECDLEEGDLERKDLLDGNLNDNIHNTNLNDNINTNTNNIYKTNTNTNNIYKTNTNTNNKTNISNNTIINNKIAIIYSNDNNIITKYTYKKTLYHVCKISNFLTSQGLKKGDCVSIYMAMCPEAVFSVLACARLGLVHNVIFGGFSVDSILMRLEDSNTKFLITADKVERNGSVIVFSDNVRAVLKKKSVNVLVFDDICEGDVNLNGFSGNSIDRCCDSIENKDGIDRSGYSKNKDGIENKDDIDNGNSIDNGNTNKIGNQSTINENNTSYNKSPSNNNTTTNNKSSSNNKSNPHHTTSKLHHTTSKSTTKIHYWSNIKKTKYKYTKPIPVSSEHPLFYLYTSGSTGKPKGMIHTTSGYLVYASLTIQKCFDLKKDDIFCCTADIGWITGHTYSIYGPLLNGITTVIIGGTPIYPTYYRLHSLVQELKITQLYTAPTVIRTLRKYFSTNKFNNKFDLSSLRLLGSVGEPINKEAYKWFTEVFNYLHVVDSYWQTETGGIVIAPLPFTVIGQPECASLPMYGIEPVVISSSVIDCSSCVDGVINSCVSSSVNGVNSVDSIKDVNDANNIVVNNVSNVNIINTNITSISNTTSNENISPSTITPPKIAQPYELGHIAIKKPWPGMARGILNDPKRYNTYFNSSGYYITGDEGYKDNQNLFWIRGRADDVINVSGHRLSTAEIESATCVDPYVSEAAVVPVDDEITGQAVCIFVVPKYVIKGNYERCNESGIKDTVSGIVGNVGTVSGIVGNVNTVSGIVGNVNTVSGIVGNKMENNVNVNTINKDTVNIMGNTINKDTVNKKTLNPTQEEIIKSVKQTLRNRIGKLVAPKNVYVVEGLPKTATGKIMRRVLRDVLSGRVPDDMSTCINVEVLKGINFSGGKVE